MMQAIIEVAKPLGISVHNHIIVGKEGHASFQGLKLICLPKTMRSTGWGGDAAC
jgi:hypothetical protein